MENKDVGDFILPCTTCIKNCFRIHSKCEEKESFDGCSYFFKVMLGDFTQKLRIPPAFVPKLLNEIGIGKYVLMQGPSGQQWDVKLCCTSTEMHFVQGWEKFVHHNKIQIGDFLVFKYVCRSYFKVRIFGRSGCQKISTVFAPENTHQECNQPMDSKLSLDLVPECQGQVLAKRHCGHPPKEQQIETVKRRYRKNFYVSNRRPVTEEERTKALQAAQSFRSNKPFGLIVLKQSYVYNTIWLRIPNVCRDRLQLPREKTKVVLVDPNNKEWDVQYLGTGNQPGLCGGWRYFSIDNNLEEGDVCIFEQADNSENKLKLRVHIFRVVEICTPYTWIKGGQMNDSVGLLTNYSNEKNKTEDLAINLPSKTFTPKPGLDAKEVNTVSREDLAGKFSANAFGPEQGIHTKEINTVSREDLAANLSAKAFGPEQGRDAKEVNTFSREDLAANLSAKVFGPEQGRDAKEVNTVSREDLSANLSARAFGPEQRKDEKQINSVSREDLAVNMLARTFGPEQGIKQVKDAKQVYTVSREDIATYLSVKAFGPEQSKNAKLVNSVSREDLSVNMLPKALGVEQGLKQVQHTKQVNTVSREDLAMDLSANSFGPEQRKDAKLVNSVLREDLAIMLDKALGHEQQIKQVQDEKQVNTFSRENLSSNLSAKAFRSEQRKDEKHVNSVLREDPAVNMLAKVFGPEPKIKQIQEKKKNMRTGRNKRAKSTLGISEKKEGCRRSLRLVQHNNLVEHPKKELLCPASSVDGKKTIVKDTKLLSKKTSSLDIVNGYSEEEDMIIWDNNAATHAMPSGGSLILS